MSDSGGKSEVTETDIRKMIAEEMTAFIERHREEIIKRAHERLKQVKEEQKREEKL